MQSPKRANFSTDTPAAGRAKPSVCRTELHLVSLIFRKVDQADGRVRGKIVEAKRLLEPGFPVKLVGFSQPDAAFREESRIRRSF